MRLGLFYSILLFTIVDICRSETGEAKGQPKPTPSANKNVPESGSTKNIIVLATPTATAHSSTLRNTVNSTIANIPVTSSSVTEKITETPSTTKSTVTRTTQTTPTTTVTRTPPTTVEKTSTKTTTKDVTTTTNTSTKTGITVAGGGTATEEHYSTDNAHVVVPNHAVTDTQEELVLTTAATDEHPIRTMIIVGLTVIPIIIIAIVIAVLLYKKKQKNNKDSSSSKSLAIAPKRPHAASSTVTPSVGPTIAPSHALPIAITAPAPVASRVPMPPPSNSSARNPARSDNEQMSNRKPEFNQDDETQVEMSTERDVHVVKDPFGPYKQIPSHQISKGTAQKKTNNGAPITNIAPQQTPMNRIVSQAAPKLNFDCRISDSDADDTQVYESVIDDYSDKQKKAAKSVDQKEKTSNGKNVNIEMINYDGQWRIVDKVGSDFSFSIASAEDLV